MAGFTEEEVKLLKESPYVEFVSSYQVNFTEEFKVIAAAEHSKGKKMSDIFYEHGINPSILGAKRIQNFAGLLNRKKRMGEDYSDKRKNNSRSIRDISTENTADQIKHLQHELAYTRQEVEFLKKIYMADLEAQKQWESNHKHR